MEWLTVMLTAVLSVVSLFVIAKIMGHKQLAQMDFFDYISGITIGSIAAELATELEKPFKPLIALVIYGVASVILGMVTRSFPKSRKFINGSPTILLNNGKLYRRNLKKAKLDLSEFMVLCREQGYFDLREIQTAVFEHNGKLTVLPVSKSRPLTPDDLKLQPPPSSIQTEIIMDGRIMDENLRRMGLDVRWLQKQLKTQGYRHADEVFLGLCDTDHHLILFGME